MSDRNPYGFVYSGPDPIPLTDILREIGQGLIVAAAGAGVAALFGDFLSIAHSGII